MGYGLLNALRLAENMGNTSDSYRLEVQANSLIFFLIFEKESSVIVVKINYRDYG